MLAVVGGVLNACADSVVGVGDVFRTQALSRAGLHVPTVEDEEKARAAEIVRVSEIPLRQNVWVGAGAVKRSWSVAGHVGSKEGRCAYWTRLATCSKPRCPGPITCDTERANGRMMEFVSNQRFPEALQALYLYRKQRKRIVRNRPEVEHYIPRRAASCRRSSPGRGAGHVRSGRPACSRGCKPGDRCVALGCTLPSLRRRELLRRPTPRSCRSTLKEGIGHKEGQVRQESTASLLSAPGDIIRG